MTLSRALAVPDHNLMRRVNRWRAPRWVRWWMLLATRAGDGWLWGAIGIALLMSTDPLRFRAIESAACAVTKGRHASDAAHGRAARAQTASFVWRLGASCARLLCAVGVGYCFEERLGQHWG